MNLVLIIVTVLIIAFVFSLIFFFQLRNYRLLELTLEPIEESLPQNDYADILLSIKSSANNLGRSLDKKGSERGFRFEGFRPIYETKRPFSTYVIGKHLPGGFANLSEVARKRFITDRAFMRKIKDIFRETENAILQKDDEKLIRNLALYYRELRTVRSKEDKSVNKNEAIEYNQNLVDDLELIKASVCKFDVASAYLTLNKWLEKKFEHNEEYDPFDRLNDYELVFLQDLRGRLECFVQGSEYYLSRKDSEIHLENISLFIAMLISSFRNGNPSILTEREIA